jgi:hypothetical protein
MDPRHGQLVLGLSSAGFPLTQLAIRMLGRRGAVITVSICLGLAVRDAALIASGTPARLRRGPALLLWLELAAALAAAGLGLRLATDPDAAGRSAEPRPDRAEIARRAAVGTLFGLHTMRFRIYLQPNHGRKPAAA